MVQGYKKNSGGGKPAKSQNSNSAKHVKQRVNQIKVRKGAPLKPPKHMSSDALEEMELSRAIDKSNEQKVAAKLIQDGKKIALCDIMTRGKELNRENRRSQVKRKLTRVEEKLQELKASAESSGLA